MRTKRVSWAVCVLNPSIESLNLIFWTEQPIVVGHMPPGDESLWLQIEIIDTISALCWFMVQWGLYLSLWPEETICGFDHMWFSFASSFPFLVNPSRTKSTFYNTYYIVLFPAQNPSKTPHWSQIYTHSIVGKELHNQNSAFLSGTISLPLLFPVHSCPFFKHIFKCSSNSYLRDQQYPFTSLFNIKSYYFSFVWM